MTYNEFVSTTSKEYENWRKIDSTYRYGQCVFNILAALRPDISEQIRATKIDPFYREYVSQDFWSFVEERW